MMNKVDDLLKRHPILQGYPHFRGVECAQGWIAILDRLCYDLEAHIGKSGCAPIMFRQIKEKFGVLRIYFNGGDEVCRELIRAAEELSSKTCDICGSPGRMVNDGGWLRTRCAEHPGAKP